MKKYKLLVNVVISKQKYVQGRCKTILKSSSKFFTVIWLSYSQLWTIIEGTASLTQSLRFVNFRTEGHQEPRNEVGSLSPTEHQVR